MAASDSTMTTAKSNYGSIAKTTSSPANSASSAQQQQQQPLQGELLNFCEMSLEQKKVLASSPPEHRNGATIPIAQIRPEDVMKLAPMTFWEEAICVTFLAVGVPNGVITVPLSTFLVGKFVLGNVTRAFMGLGVVLLPFALMPQSFVPSTLHSYMAHLLVKYFSFRFAFCERPYAQPQPASTAGTESDKKPVRTRPQILVAPPHGVFPYGNILSMMVWPSLVGHHFLGLASSAALAIPGFKQILGSIGVVDASRSTARKALESYPHTIGISTGGVAEVYETNGHDECVLLKERVGMIKLAIRTGADLVPCYLFGNTKLLSCYMPGGRLLESISRKLGFAMVIIYGRFGLPVPRRVPVFGVAGKPVPTAHYQSEEPTEEQIAEIQEKLLAGVEEVFEKYKGLYGWEDKRLIIK